MVVYSGTVTVSADLSAAPADSLGIAQVATGHHAERLLTGKPRHFMSLQHSLPVIGSFDHFVLRSSGQQFGRVAASTDFPSATQ